MTEDTRASTMTTELETGKLNHSEFQRKCLEWVFEMWNEFVPISFEIKPQEVIDYEALSKSDKDNLDEPEYFRDNPKILWYYSHREHTWHKNKGHHLWLSDMLAYCKDQAEVDKVKHRISQFVAKIAEQGALLGIVEYIAQGVPGAEETRVMFGGRYE